MSTQLELRPRVAAFAQAMERKLRDNDHKRGWVDDWPTDLMCRLQEEVDELQEVVERYENDTYPASVERKEEVLAEAADVANFAMMVADVCGVLDVPRAPRIEDVLAAAYPGESL